MDLMPSVIGAQYQGSFQIRVTVNDGLEATVDFGRWLRGPVFEPLKNLKYFQHFFIDGGTVVWPNGSDIAPEALYEAAKASQRADNALEPVSTAKPARRRGAARRP